MRMMLLSVAASPRRRGRRLPFGLPHLDRLQRPKRRRRAISEFVAILFLIRLAVVELVELSDRLQLVALMRVDIVLRRIPAIYCKSH